jgi:C4-type Zn-finger protein
MYLVRFSENREPGTYKPAIRESDQSKTAIVVCPICATKLHLQTHRIDYQGKVSPSVVCSNACSFHDFIQLQDWYPYFLEGEI